MSQEHVKSAHELLPLAVGDVVAEEVPGRPIRLMTVAAAHKTSSSVIGRTGKMCIWSVPVVADALAARMNWDWFLPALAVGMVVIAVIGWLTW